jgi:hypothetical protein
VGKLLLAGCSPQGGTLNDERRTLNEGGTAVAVTSDNLAVGTPPDWMMELAKMLILKDLPMGVIVGSAVIEKCERMEDGGSRMENSAIGDARSSILNPPSSSGAILNPPSSLFGWHLADVQRAKKFRKPKGHPQPVWFRPFD